MCLARKNDVVYEDFPNRLINFVGADLEKNTYNYKVDDFEHLEG